MGFVMISCQAPSWASVSREERGMALEKQYLQKYWMKRVSVLAFRELTI